MSKQYTINDLVKDAMELIDYLDKKYENDQGKISDIMGMAESLRTRRDIISRR